MMIPTRGRPWLALAAGVLAAACVDGAEPDLPARAPELSPPPSGVPATAPPPAPVADAEGREWLYVHGTLNVRAGPHRDARLLRALVAGDRVQLGPADPNGWARLYGPGTEEGYVYRASRLVSADPPEAARREPTPGYHLGPRGGCYTYTRNGTRRYVDRARCN